LRQQGDGRVVLQPCIILGGLAGVEPDDVEEKAPGQGSGPRPDQPRGRQDDEDSGGLVERENRHDPPAVRSSLGDDFDVSRRSFRSCDESQLGALLIGDEPHPSEGGHCARALFRADRNAAHPCKIEPIAGSQASLKSGRCRFIREWPPHVGDEAIIVRVESEGAEGLHQATEVRDDHRQRPQRDRHKDHSTCALAQALHAGLNSWQDDPYGGRSQDHPVENNHTLPAMRTMPAGRASGTLDVLRSKRANNARKAIQNTFITPPTSNSAIRAQQQPTQYAPCRSPSETQPGASW
jgi:hypothetical protein